MFLLRSLLQSELLVKIYFDVSTGCLHFEIYQEDTRSVLVVREKKKKTLTLIVTVTLMLNLTLSLTPVAQLNSFSELMETTARHMVN